MNFIVIKSLQHTSLVKIAVILWSQDDIRTLLKNFNFPSLDGNSRGKWLKIENKVMKKVPELLLPETLKNKILNFVKPVGLQILEWMKYHVNDNYLRINLPNNLYWTSQGTVDVKRTAEVLINDVSLDITKRYKLACINCLENDIPLLWNEIPNNRKRSLCDRWVVENQHTLVIFWTSRMNVEATELSTVCMWPKNFIKCPFELATFNGHTVAAEYFLSQLSPEEREESFVGCVISPELFGSDYLTYCVATEDCTMDVLCFLLSHMNAEEQMAVFRTNPYMVLNCLLGWPWQDFYLKAVELMWDFLSEECYCALLHDIVDKVMMGYRDYNYQKLFGMFWQQSPKSHKKYVINLCSDRFLLSKLFLVNDKESVMLILKDATVAKREEIIFHDNGKDICKDLVFHEKWDLLRFFIKECISSTSLLIKLGEEFKELRITCSLLNHPIKNKSVLWKKFFQLLDDLIRDSKKRSIQDGDRYPSKRLCNIEFLKELHK